MFFLITS